MYNKNNFNGKYWAIFISNYRGSPADPDYRVADYQVTDYQEPLHSDSSNKAALSYR
jgi:hypothetical protein